MDQGLLIGEVAAQTGVSRKALRLYEARGILPPARRTSSGYRTYSRDVLGVLHFVTQARRLGLTLSEIGSIVALRCAKPGPCVNVRALLERKIAELDDVRRELRRILDSWEASSQRPGGNAEDRVREAQGAAGDRAGQGRRQRHPVPRREGGRGEPKAGGLNHSGAGAVRDGAEAERQDPGHDAAVGPELHPGLGCLARRAPRKEVAYALRPPEVLLRLSSADRGYHS
jgi:MerR family copper efflux transcriptional regulator